MEIIRGLHNIRERHRGCVSTIGTFDGVHLGHRQLLQRLLFRAAELNTFGLLVTFEPQPREYFRGSLVPARLTRFREKVALLEQEGVTHLLCIPFNERTRSISAQDVVERFLVELLQVRLLIVGDDFRFGTNAEGDFDMLAKAGEKFGFDTERMGTFELDGERISSSRIREALADGDFDNAKKLLGREYFMMGNVVKGQQIGKSIGIPTANIRLQRYRSALSGIFAVCVDLGSEEFSGTAYVGTRPTLQGKEPLLEVHLFDFDRNLYGSHLRVRFLKKFREDRSFGSFDDLRVQMERDLIEIKSWFLNRTADLC